MRKIEIVNTISTRADVSPKVANEILNAFCEIVSRELAEGGKVTIPGFGTFETSEYGPRAGRNPATGEALEIPGGRRPRFKAGSVLKKAVSG